MSHIYLMGSLKMSSRAILGNSEKFPELRWYEAERLLDLKDMDS